MFSVHCGCFVILSATIACVVLSVAISGSPMYNKGFAIVPCANSTAATVPSTHGGLWCRGPDVQTPLVTALVWFALYCGWVMANPDRFRLQFMRRVSWSRGRVQAPVCWALVAYALVHYSGSTPGRTTVAVLCTAAALVPLQGLLHDAANARREHAGRTETIYPPDTPPWILRFHATTRALRDLTQPDVLADLAATLVFTLVFVTAATDVPAGQYRDSLPGTAAATVWITLALAWAGLAFRTVSKHFGEDVCEAVGFVLAWVQVYAPILIVMMAPSVHTPRRH